MTEVEISKPDDLTKLHGWVIKEVTMEKDGAPYYRFRLQHPLAEKDIYACMIPLQTIEVKGIHVEATAGVGLKIQDCED